MMKPKEFSILFIPHDGSVKAITFSKGFIFFFFATLTFFFITSLSYVILYQLKYYELKEIESIIVDESSYFQELNQTEKSLKNILTYVKGQKLKLQETEQLLRSLKSEQKELEPIVKTDRETVDKILAIQKKIDRKLIWIDRFFAYISGVITSVIGGLIIYKFTKKETAVQISDYKSYVEKNSSSDSS